MRIKLKNDVFFLPVEDGVYLKNNQCAFTLRGKTIYAWLEQLVPYLTGDHTLEALCRDLTQDKKTMLSNLVNLLMERGFIKEVVEDEGHNLSQAELEIYRSQIEFIDYFQNLAASRFERFRTARVLLIGSDFTVASAAHSLMDSGLRRINLLFTGEDEARRLRILQYVEHFSGKDALIEFHEQAAINWQQADSVTRLIADYDIVLHASDTLMLDRVRLLNRCCVGQGKIFLQGMMVDGVGWVGPLALPGEAGCWECAWQRYLSASPSATGRSDAGSEICRKEEYFSPTAAAIVGNTITFEIFKHLTGAGEPEPHTRVFFLNLETLETSFHSFLPHPVCSTCSPEPPQTASEILKQFEEIKEQQATGVWDDFSHRAQELVDERFGIFTRFGPGDLAQLPLTRCEAAIANQEQENQSPATRNVIAAGRSHYEAQYWAARGGLETYLSLLADERRFIYGTFAELNQEAINPNRIWGRGPEEISCEEKLAWVYGYDLLKHQPRLVPAASVFPRSKWNRTQKFDIGATGLASGHSLDEVIARGILSFVRARAVKKLQQAASDISLVSLASLDDPESLSYLGMISRYEKAIGVYDISNGLQVPTLAFSLDSRIVAYSAHFNDVLALRDGLKQVIETLQGRSGAGDGKSFAELQPLDREFSLGPARSLDFYSRPAEQEWAEIAAELLNRCLLSHQEVVLVCLLDRYLLPGAFLAGRAIAAI